MISRNLRVGFLLQLGIWLCQGQTQQFLQLQPPNPASSPNLSKRFNPGNLSARSYSGSYASNSGPGAVPASITNDYRSSHVSDPFMRYPNTDNMNFHLPGAPRPPDPPALIGGGIGGSGVGVNYQYQPFLNMWNNYPGVGSAYSATNGGGGGYGANINNNGNNYFGPSSGGGGSGGGYGSNGGYDNNQQSSSSSGNGAINYGTSGVNSNGYRPSSSSSSSSASSSPTPAGPGTNAYGNVQNGFIVSSGQNGKPYVSAAGGQYGGNSYSQVSTASPNSVYGSGGYGSSNYGDDVMGSANAYSTRRSCVPDMMPNFVGTCSVRNQLKRRCRGLYTAVSKDCGGKELCCFDPKATPAPAGAPATTAPVTTTVAVTAASTTKSPATVVSPVAGNGNGGSVGNGNGGSGDGGSGNGGNGGSAGSGSAGNGNGDGGSGDGSSGVNGGGSSSGGGYDYGSGVVTEPTDRFCIPDAHPAVSNGVCRSNLDVTAKCTGVFASTSTNCYNDESCCYNLPGGSGSSTVSPVTASPSPATVKTTVTTTVSAVTTSASGTVSTTPSPTVGPTTVVLTTVASTETPSTATVSSSTTANSVTLPATRPPAGLSCRPGRYPNSPSNGICVAPNQLSQLCKGLQLDYSLDCEYYQYCCYAHGNQTETYPVPITIAPGSCTPDSKPTVRTGFCVDGGDLVERCSRIEASTSPNCGSTQFCCYTDRPSTTSSVRPPSGTTTITTSPSTVTVTSSATVTTASGATSTVSSSPSSSSPTSTVAQTTATTKGSLTTTPSSGACKPDNNPSVSGVCVDGAKVTQVCNGKEMSTSNGCAQGQFCCYGVSSNYGLATTTSSPTTSTVTPSVTSTGITSATTGSSSTGTTSTITTTSTGPPFTQAPTTTTSGLTLGTTSTSSITGPTPRPVNCSPQNSPNIQNGVCTSLFSLSSQCSGLQAAPSVSCGTYEYCCYTNTGIEPGTIPAGSCSPDNNHAITNGVCVSAGQLASQCNGNDISASPQCDVDQYCCFSPNGQPITTTTKISVASTTAPSSTVVTNGPSSTSTSVVTSSSVRPSTVPTTSATVTRTEPSGADMIYGTTAHPTGSCIPASQPDATDGQCVGLGQLAEHCKGGRVAKSDQCLPYQFCCFGTGNPAAGTTAGPSVSSTGGSSGGQCSPSTAPDVTNGICTDISNLGASCQGQRISKSPQCRSTQYCCFGPANPDSTTKPSVASTTVSPVPSTTVPSVSSTTAPSVSSTTVPSPPLTTSSSTVAQCSPSTAPDVKNGICTDTSNLAVSCPGQRISRSPQCQPSQYCCFGQANPEPVGSTLGPSVSSTVVPTVSSTTTPSASPTTQSVSSPATTGSTSGGQCSPSTAPDVTDGFCTDSSQLASQCQGRRISRAPQCQLYQYCCFGGGDAPATTVATSAATVSSSPASQASTTVAAITTGPAATTTQSSATVSSKPGGAGGTCSPSTAPSVTNGACVSLSQISAQCQGQRIAKSTDCQTSEYCCFTSYGSGQVTEPADGATCSPNTAPSVHNGVCTATAHLAAQCKGQRISKSVDCGSTQFCCFADNTGSIGGGGNNGACTPNTSPIITNGVCTDVGQLSSSCRGLTFSKSAQCSSSQFCCFNGQHDGGGSGGSGGGSGSGGSQPSGACTPKTQPSITNGTCVQTAQLSAKCRGLTFSKSGNCNNDEFCCFGGGVGGSNGGGGITQAPYPVLPVDNGSGGSMAGGKCSPSTDPTVKDGVCTTSDQLASQCTGKRMSKSTDCPIVQFCCFSGTPSGQPGSYNSGLGGGGGAVGGSACSPTTQPSISNGVCTNVADLSKQCSGKRLSKSADCLNNQYCCFSGGDAVNGGSGTGPCSPNSEPTVKNGVCTAPESLTQKCSGMRLSKSGDCANGQYCCFTSAPYNTGGAGGGGGSSGGGNGGSGGGACSPNTEPSVQDGVCTIPDNLAKQCTGKRLSKSVNCSTTEFCCFTSPSSSGGSGSGNGGSPSGGSGDGGSSNGGSGNAGAACSPSTEPSSSGVCTSSAQLSQQCTGKRVSKSPQCPPEQFCCFTGSYGGDGGGGAGVGSQACSPNTQPSITNGNCVSPSQLSAQCRRLTFSKSAQCAASDFCCFNATSVGGTVAPPAASSCSPSSAPDVTNGVCTNTALLTTKCQGQRISKSPNCGTGQYCCFNAYGSSSPGGSDGGSAPGGPGSGSPPSATPSSGGANCSPQTQPGITNGKCVGKDQLNAQCGALRFSRSADCQTDQYCCFGQAASQPVEGGSSTPAGPSSGSCSPKTAPAVTNGKCVNSGDLTVQCIGQRMSKSDNCASSQFCCFDQSASGSQYPASPAPSSGGATCSPQSQPSITNGKCVNNGDLTSQCAGQRMSKSDNCASGQFCCFDQMAGGGGIGGGGASCSPLTQPSITNGKCVNNDQLTAQCGALRLSKSADCQTNQYCCFSGSSSSQPAGGASTPSPSPGPVNTTSPSSGTKCSPQTEPTVTNGRCVDTGALSTSCAGQRLSKSSDCQTSQYCCFDGAYPAPAPSGSTPTSGPCTPNTEPSINDGQCVDQSQVVAQCSAKRMSKSANCSSTQFCCFSATGAGGVGGGGANNNNGGSCTPQSNPSVHNGVCTELGALSQTCQGRQISKSTDCLTSQFCCFNSPTVGPYPIPIITGGGCTPNTEPSVKNGTCVDLNQLTTQCQDLRFSKSTQCQASQFCCFTVPVTSPQNQCTPETEPTITNGVCLVSADLPARCNGALQRAAKSINCLSSQWCCFSGAQVPVYPPTTAQLTDGTDGGKISLLGGDNKVKITVEDGHCTPNSDPLARGTCVTTRDLPKSCADLRASPSLDCPRFSWCCFGSSNATTMATTTTTLPSTTTTTETIKLVNPIKIDILIPDTAVKVPAATKLSVGPACTPNVNSSIHDGQCMRMREISERCVDRRASPSFDCPMGQWCCFGDSSTVVALTNEEATEVTTVATTTTSTDGRAQCAPNSNRALRNGQCLTIRELQASCVERQAAPSPDCEMGRWCCYSEPATDKDAVDVTEAATDATTTTVAVVVEDGARCTPNAEPTVENGACMPTKDLRSKCRNRRVSKSPQCRMGQWCCFTDPKGNATSGEFSPLGRSVNMGAL
ncbi:hypothetical protein BV898_09201 [Hypsibius exemplaris]|uniref:WAP domain-containing protein n=1 Tax=Hypsibius exemplaris TaxID=2072580 RepID=A0A1W0WN95_HYPEX|nr:hypothetical protein BV898_09201 [Hypsibius exemplaris]